MIAYFLIRRWRSKPCPRCQKRVKRGALDCVSCGARLRWDGNNVMLDE